MSKLLIAIAIGSVVSGSPVAAAVAPGEPVVSHSQLDELENHVGLLGLLGLLGLFALRGRDRRR